MPDAGLVRPRETQGVAPMKCVRFVALALPVALAAGMVASTAYAEAGSGAGPSAEVRQRAEELAREAHRRYDELMRIERVAQAETGDARSKAEPRTDARSIPAWMAAWLERSDRAYRGLVRRLFSGGEASPPPGQAPRSIVRRSPAEMPEKDQPIGWDWLTHSDDGFQAVMRRLSVRQAWDPARDIATTKPTVQPRPVEDQRKAAQAVQAAAEAKTEQEKQAAAQIAAAEASKRAEADARAKAAEDQRKAAQAAQAAEQARVEREKQAAAQLAAAEASKQAEADARAKEAEWVAQLQRRQAEDRQKAAQAAAKAEQERTAREAVAAQAEQAQRAAEQRQAEARKRAEEDAARIAAAKAEQDRQRAAAAAKAEQERRVAEAATAQARAREQQRAEQEKQAQEAAAAKAERTRQEAERLAQAPQLRDEKAPRPGEDHAAAPPATVRAPSRPAKVNSTGTARDHKARRGHTRPVYHKRHRRHRGPHCSSLGGEANTAGWYRARDNDTLWSIAERHYGAGRLYRRIYAANRRRLRDPDVVRPCQRLYIPRAGRAG